MRSNRPFDAVSTGPTGKDGRWIGAVDARLPALPQMRMVPIPHRVYDAASRNSSRLSKPGEPCSVFSYPHDHSPERTTGVATVDSASSRSCDMSVAAGPSPSFRSATGLITLCAIVWHTLACIRWRVVVNRALTTRVGSLGTSSPTPSNPPVSVCPVSRGAPSNPRYRAVGRDPRPG